MEQNIFKNAKFGDKFVTRDGKIAIYHYYNGSIMKQHYLILESGYGVCCRENGCEIGYKESDNDIVSRYQEPIDEEKLNKLVWYEAFKKYDIHLETENIENIIQHRDGFIEGFKAGYHKAKEK